MPTRRFVPNRFSRLLLLSAAAFLCTELTRKCSKVAPVYWPLMAILILLSLALLLYFAVSAVLFLYEPLFPTGTDPLAADRLGGPWTVALRRFDGPDPGGGTGRYSRFFQQLARGLAELPGCGDRQ